MKKILVMSDSHGGTAFMRRCVKEFRPDAMIHLGDFHEDGMQIQAEFPHIPMIQVPGNCDHYRYLGPDPEIRCHNVCSVRLYMTHGHRHNVKLTRSLLIRDARELGAQAALYGHSHQADCYQTEDGLWVLNPGASGHYGGSVGLMEVEDGKILSCQILTDADIPY